METDERVYHPHTKDSDSTLYCFKDAGRPCSAECVAYDLPPEHKDFKGKAWARCMLLVNEHRKGKNLVVIAECMNSVRNFIEDSARNNQPLPPKVR